jgi:2-C-methyl-D-erythritol 4-phosphate cytidylyltransferase
VLVHDAARPFVSPETIDAVISASGEGGAVPAVPVADTLKRADAKSGLVSETVDRVGLWRAQTPQGFPRKVLEEAFRRAEETGFEAFTDESSLVEAAGFPVRLVPDDPRNIKITTPSDLAIAHALASQ